MYFMRKLLIRAPSYIFFTNWAYRAAIEPLVNAVFVKFMEAR